MYSLRQRSLAFAEEARNVFGKPPNCHNLSKSSTSPKVKGVI
jgi:hypothetical protein